MKNFSKRVYLFLNQLGFDPRVFLYFLKGLIPYIIDYGTLRKQLRNNHNFRIVTYYPSLSDKYMSSGTMKGHYFHQDLLIARRIFENNPIKHIDIGSRIDGFVSHIAVFRKIEIFDIRQQESSIKNIYFRQADLMQLPEEMTGYCDSISSLHVIEYFGLGRYGDPIDVNGHLKAIENIYKILTPQGKFYFSVPIGKQRIEFNAHRVFSLKYLLQILEGKFKIDCFSFVDDNGDLNENIKLTKEDVELNFNCNYGCGIFELTKIESI